MQLKKYKKNNQNIKWIKISVLFFASLSIAFAVLTSNLSITGNILVSVPTCDVNNKLYNVLKCEAVTRGLAKEYIGEHQDSMNSSLSTEKIYHWYASNDLQGTAIKDKNNVIFANHCWQIIRTTDTGGVKLIYNGEVENNQCLDTRGNHMGHNNRLNLYLTNATFATDYTYNPSTQNFTLAGTITSGRWTSETDDNFVGKYICYNTQSNETCDRVTLLGYTYNSSGPTATYIFPSSSHYSQFGKITYDDESGSYHNSIRNVGYMYNDFLYEGSIMYNTEFILNSTSLSTSYYYADSYDYNTINSNKYTLENPYQVSSSSEYQSLVGKYTLRSSSSTYSSDYIYYIVGVNGNIMYYISVGYGNSLSNYNNTYTYGDNYTDNGNGTYTINNPTTINKTDYYSNYNNLVNKYVIVNAVNNTGSEIWHISNANPTTLYMFKSSNTKKYANSFTYNSSNNKYTLGNNSQMIWDLIDNDNFELIKDNHYTCSNATGECQNISYIYGGSPGYLKYVNVNNGQNITEALESQTDNNNHSIIKVATDAWYKKYLYNSYDNYIEDVIYCNDREIAEYNGWNPNNHSLNENILFNAYYESTNLKCPRTKDSFSISNNQAKLDYKVGLVTSPEMLLLGNSNARNAGEEYWTMTPTIIGDGYNAMSRINMIDINGDVHETDTYGDGGLRPTISLKPNTSFISGNGTKVSPYIIN